MPSQRQSARRTAAITGLCAAALLTAVAMPATPATAQGEGFQKGTASAIAQSYKVNPTASGLSIGVTFGLSLSDYTNTVSRAESRAIDLGVLGTTLGAPGCDGGDPTLPAEKQPQSVFVDSRDPGADKGKSEQEKYAPLITKSARANGSPESEAVTTTAPIDVPGVLHVDGAVSRTLTHVIDGTTREALATTDIANVSLAGGAVVLKGLHWESRYLSGDNAKPSSAFTVGNLIVGGKAQAMPSDTNALTDAVNKVTGNLGIALRAPTFRSDNGINFVSPMAIAIVPNKTRDGLVHPLLDAAFPARQSLFDALLKADCHFADGITVFDIAVGSLTGAGQLSVELGGVQASSGELTTTSFLGQFADAADLPTALPATGDLVVGSGGETALGSVGTGTAGARPAAGPSRPGVSGKPGTRLDATPAAITTGSRGGKLAAVAAAVLALVALLAEADRRVMRRGRRTIPTEAP